MLGDTLMCSYHGWQFAEGGKCVDVPQAQGTQGNARACASQRSCVASFPTTVRHLALQPPIPSNRILTEPVCGCSMHNNAD